jgi:putative hydrolase of the HAD superfamily
MQRFSHIDTWVFDLDGTLYDAVPHVFPVMERLMGDYIADFLKIGAAEAAAHRSHLYRTHGTTLHGLMKEHAVDPHAFLEYCHRINLDPVLRCAETARMLQALPGRKVVFTNAPGFWAKRMLVHLGIADLFDGIYGIEDAELTPKPQAATYARFMALHNINPATACMLEDMLENLKPAHDAGMTTVWLHHRNAPATSPHALHVHKDIKTWLEQLEKNG